MEYDHGLIADTLLDYSKKNGEALIDSVRRGDIERVKVAVTEGVSVNFVGGSGNTALHWAAHNNHVAIVELLLEEKANVDVQADVLLFPLGLLPMKGVLSGRLDTVAVLSV